ncbi:MAG: hypothetical protein ACKVS6_16190 [Planctomycetota bacterium]
MASKNGGCVNTNSPEDTNPSARALAEVYAHSIATSVVTFAAYGQTARRHGNISIRRFRAAFSAG